MFIMLSWNFNSALCQLPWVALFMLQQFRPTVVTLHWVCKGTRLQIGPRHQRHEARGWRHLEFFSPNFLLDFPQRRHRCEAAVEEITQMIPAGCSSSRSSRYASFLPNCCHLHTSSTIKVKKVKFEHFISSANLLSKFSKSLLCMKWGLQLCCCSHSSTNMFQVK